MFTLYLKDKTPCESAELAGEFILTNNVILPKHIDLNNSFNPYNIGLWVIGNEYGALCALWGSDIQDALDAACDADLLDSMLSEDQDYDDESLTSLGNAGELFDLTYAWVSKVEFDAKRDIALILAIVRACENNEDNLENQE